MVSESVHMAALFGVLPDISINYVIGIEILVIISIIIFVLYIFYSLNLFKKR